jgi:hypothetical protein
LAHHESRYAESTFSQFCQEYLLDTARKVWWESNHPDDAQPLPSLDVVLPRFFDSLKSTAMAHVWELFPTPAINPNRVGPPQITKRNHRTNWLSVKQSHKPSYWVNLSYAMNLLCQNHGYLLAHLTKDYKMYHVIAASATCSRGTPRGDKRCH